MYFASVQLLQHPRMSGIVVWHRQTSLVEQVHLTEVALAEAITAEVLAEAITAEVSAEEITEVDSAVPIMQVISAAAVEDEADPHFSALPATITVAITDH